MLKWASSVATSMGLIAAGLALAPPADAASWQSIYFDGGTFPPVYFSVAGYGSKGEAQAGALTDCVQLKRTGGPSLEAVTSSQCVALAWGRKASGEQYICGGNGPTADAAAADVRAKFEHVGEVQIAWC